MSGFVPIIATLLLGGYILMDALLNDQLWDLNTRFVEKLQQHESTVLNAVFDFFTYIVFVPPGLAFVAFVVMDCKLNVLIYAIVTIASVTANEILKNIYHQPRPYMVETSIQGLKCNADYGKPSGHAQNSMVLVYLMPSLIFPQLYRLRDLQKQKEEIVEARSHTGYTIDSYDDWQGTISENHIIEPQSTSTRVFKVLIIVVLTFSLFMTGLSRVYLGVHSIGQVMLGWAYAAYIIVIFLWVFKHSLRFHSLQAFQSFNSSSQKYSWVVPVFLLMLGFLVCVAILFFEMNRQLIFVTGVEVQDWVFKINECNLHNNKVTDYTETSPSVLFNGVFQTTMIGSAITGLMIGGYFCKGRYAEGYFFKNFKNQSWADIFKRIGVLIFMNVVLVPFIFINSQNVYIQAFCQILPVGFILGFLLTYAFPQLCHLLRIQVKGDIFHQSAQLLDASSNLQLKEALTKQLSMEAQNI